MLPIKRRVKKESFAKIMKDGVFLHAPNLYLRFLCPTSLELHGANLQASRFGFVVPNKVKKTSVGRHLIKRSLTSIVEKVLPEIRNGFSCLFFVKKDITLISNQEIEKETIDLLKKAKILS
ncbi:MAG: ribonuclease P protein component [bacterium]